MGSRRFRPWRGRADGAIKAQVMEAGVLGMSETIGVRPWMSEPATARVMDALEARGFAGCARFVGGCVRNSVMGKPIDDVDIATTLTPDQVTEALVEAGIKAVPTGVEHGTVTAVAGGKPFEITTLRRDVSTDGRNATVAFTHDWAEDARRRDFRFNALYADRTGAVFDPTGEGVADAKVGRVVFVGDPMTRVREDYLRILRFFRFEAWYGGKAAPDAAALSACKALKGMLAGRAAERVSKELLKLLAAPDPRIAMAAMALTGVLAEILPPAKDRARFEALVTIAADNLWEPDPVLRLAALLPDPRTASAMAERLRLSNAQHDRLVGALGGDPRIVSWMSPKAARRAVYQAGPGVFADRVKLAWAATPSTAATPQWMALLALGSTWTAPVMPITGEDVVAAGVPKGPLVGRVLREIEDWWMDHDFTDDHAAAVEQLKAAAQGMAF